MLWGKDYPAATWSTNALFRVNAAVGADVSYDGSTMDTIRNFNDLHGLSWRSFDEICLQDPDSRLAAVIYFRYKRHPAPWRSIYGELPTPETRLCVLVANPYDRLIQETVKAMVGGAAEDSGWLV